MGNKILRRATLWLLVLFAVFCFAPFSSSADDGYDAHFLFGMTAVRRRRMVQRITAQSTTFR